MRHFKESSIKSTMSSQNATRSTMSRDERSVQHLPHNEHQRRSRRENASQSAFTADLCQVQLIESPRGFRLPQRTRESLDPDPDQAGARVPGKISPLPSSRIETRRRRKEPRIPGGREGGRTLGTETGGGARISQPSAFSEVR